MCVPRSLDIGRNQRHNPKSPHAAEIEFFIDNLLVRIHFIIVMIRWSGLAPLKFEFPFPGSLTSTFLRTWQVPGVRAVRVHRRLRKVLPQPLYPNLLSSYLLLSRLELSDTRVYEPLVRALLGSDSHFCEVVVRAVRLRRGLRNVPQPLYRTPTPIPHHPTLLHTLASYNIAYRNTPHCGILQLPTLYFSSSLLLSSLELSDTKVYGP